MNKLARAAALVLAFVLLPAATALGQDALFVDADGEVGIGISTPSRPLHVVDAAPPANTLIEVENGGGPARFRVRNGATGETWNIGHQSPSGTGLVYSDVGDAVSEMLLDISGNMTLAGTLTTASNTYPDYVFADDYELMPLAELATFIADRNHLPKVPTAEDVARQGGVNMSELQVLLLEKVEELTLYTLQQQELIEELRGRLASLEAAAP